MEKSNVNYEVSSTPHIPVSMLNNGNRLQNFIAALFPDLPLVGDMKAAAIDDAQGQIIQFPPDIIRLQSPSMRPECRLSALGEVYDEGGYLAIRFRYWDSEGNELTW